jgi:long-chain acyl-CoA synthetase
VGLPLARAKNLTELRDRAPVETERDGRSVSAATTPYLVQPPDHGSLADLPYVNAAEEPGAAVFSRRTEGGRWRDVTAAEFAAEVTATAKGLIAAGTGPGDRIAIMSRTCYEWTLLDFAAWAAGAVVVPIYPTASADQAAWIIRDAAVTAVVAEDEACAGVLAEAVKSAGEPPPIWRLDRNVMAELAERGTAVPDTEVERRRGGLDPSATATIIYTSGTTGMPKGAPLTHGNFLTEAVNCVALLRPVFDSVSDEPPCTLLFLPLAHVLGRIIEISCVQARIRFGHSPSIKPEELRPDLESFGATFLVGVPYLFEKIHQLGRVDAQALHAAHVYDRATRIAIRYGKQALRSLAGEGPGPSLGLRAAHLLYELLVYRKVRKALGGKIHYAISGGSALSPDLLLFFAGAGVLIYEGYGLTETTGPSTVNPPLRPRPGTVGPPVPGSAVRIAEDGEVLLRGPQVFRGYQPAAEAPSGTGTAGTGTAGTDRDGWFATGDLGQLDADGYLTITGRKKDIIITSGGKNLSPGPLEDRIRAHPLISQCMIVGDGRPYVAALVTLDPEALDKYDGHGARAAADAGVQVDSALPVPPSVPAGIAAAIAEANRSVSRAESIRRVRIVDGDFTEERGLLTPSLKVKRQAVIDAYGPDVDALYS